MRKKELFVFRGGGESKHSPTEHNELICPAYFMAEKYFCLFVFTQFPKHKVFPQYSRKFILENSNVVVSSVLFKLLLKSPFFSGLSSMISGHL